MHKKQHILFSVAGMSPAIITETLFGLQEKGIKSGEVHLLTTSHGKKSMQVLLRQIPLFNEMYHTNWEINSEWIEELLDSHKKPLADLRTFSHNETAANAIVDRIRDWTEHDNIVLHASVAGGRKTMGIYLTQAMSWLARPEDDLSHVLVSEEFERDRDFYFPDKNNSKHKNIIAFAEVPFVHLQIPPLLQKEKTYSECVKLSEIYLKDISDGQGKLVLDLNQHTLSIEKTCQFKMQPLSIALFCFLVKYANLAKEQEPFYLKQAFDYRDKLIKCLENANLSSRDSGLSGLIFKSNELPQNWEKEGAHEEIRQKRQKNLNNAFGKLHQDFKKIWSNASFQVFKGNKKDEKGGSRWVEIADERIKIIEDSF